jgi:hypothetical protein
MFDEARLPHAPVAQQHEALPVVDCLTDTALQLRPGAKGRTGAKHLSEDERIGRLRFHARNARDVLHFCNGFLAFLKYRTVPAKARSQTRGLMNNADAELFLSLD